MQSITTKYFGPGNRRGSRIKATASGGRSITLKCPVELTTDQLHAHAAQALCSQLKWPGRLVSGEMKDGGQVHVFADGFISNSAAKYDLLTVDSEIAACQCLIAEFWQPSDLRDLAVLIERRSEILDAMAEELRPLIQEQA